MNPVLDQTIIDGAYRRDASVAAAEWGAEFRQDVENIIPQAWLERATNHGVSEIAPEPKAFETLRGAGHNDTTLVGGRPYFERIGAFLDQVAPG